MKKIQKNQDNKNSQSMLDQNIGSALDIKTNEDFNNEHPDHDDYGLIKTKSENENVSKTYTCSMHPEVISDKPGKCPKCGMELIEKK